MVRPEMTKDRSKCGIPQNKAGDKIRAIDPDTKIERDFIFVKETIIKDSDGNIIGVQKEWQ